jgi:hypothetical protein
MTWSRPKSFLMTETWAGDIIVVLLKPNGDSVSSISLRRKLLNELLGCLPCFVWSWSKLKILTPKQLLSPTITRVAVASCGIDISGINAIIHTLLQYLERIYHIYYSRKISREIGCICSILNLVYFAIYESPNNAIFVLVYSISVSSI